MTAPMGNSHGFTLQAGAATGVSTVAYTFGGLTYLTWSLWIITVAFTAYVLLQMVIRTKHRIARRRLQIAQNNNSRE